MYLVTWRRTLFVFHLFYSLHCSLFRLLWLVFNDPYDKVLCKFSERGFVEQIQSSGSFIVHVFCMMHGSDAMDEGIWPNNIMKATDVARLDVLSDVHDKFHIPMVQ
jgi:hypothetical protein